MATKITSANFSPTALAAIVGPAISSVQITSSNTYATVVDDTAVPLAGGYIVLNGTGFITGCQVYLDSTVATSVTFVSSTRVNVQVPAMAAGTYVIYLVNGDGSIAIRVNGLTYSISPSWSTTSDLGGVVFGNAVSFQLAAPSDSAIVYSLQAGSTLPTGLTLSSTGLLSGIITTESETTYNFTVVATDIELQDSPRTFSISIVIGDPYFKYTTLLLNGETTTANWIADASTNSFNITLAGDTKPSAFSPYNTNWSGYFDGVGDYLVPSSAASLSGDFTTEMWIFPTLLKIYSEFYTSGSTNFEFGLNNAVLTFWSASLVHQTAVVTNKWQHVALVRSGTTIRLYLDGVQSTASATASTTYTPVNIGTYTGASESYAGYISNLRVLSGTALYTSSFTPPTSALTVITNTVLLTLQNNRFIDNSTNAFAITKNGDVTVKTFGPFTETDTTTGSGYFDGTGDYLTLPSSTAFGFGTGDFTWECWAYFPSLGDRRIFDFGNQNLLYMSSSAGSIVYYSTSERISSSALVTHQWYHIALVRGSGTTKIYLNGNQTGSNYTDTVNYPTSTLRIGADTGPTQYMNGYLSDIRIVKGSAVYTSAFTPPTTPLTAITNTSLLTLQNRIGHSNNSTLDTSGNKLLGTKFGNATQGTFSPFSQPAGYWSNYFDGTGDQLLTATSADLALQSSDFTVELWYYPTGKVQNFPVLISNGNFGIDKWAINDRHNSFPTKVSVNMYAGSTGDGWLVSTTSISLNTWYHVALVRSGSTFRLYINGVSEATNTYVGSITASTDFITLGQDQNQGVTCYKGYISNVRIVSGTALYTTATIAVPSVPLTAVSGTRLLTCQSNRFIDTSTNAIAITRSGDTLVQSFSPFKPVASYAAATNGGSGYYDGTGDYHSFPLAITNLGNFTFEFWAYSTGSVSGLAMCGSSEFEVYLAGLNISWVYQGVLSVSSGINFVLGQWNHIVICRYNWVLNAAGNFKMFVNGVMYTSPTAKGENFPIPGPFITGGSYYTNAFRTPWPGYISNVRFINGNGTIYTANFTPPTAPIIATSDTVLQLDFTNAGVIDASGRNDLETAGDARISTAVKKYGTGSISFDGTGDYLYAASSTNFELGSSDFTVEAWIYPTTITGSERGIFGIGTTDPDSNLVRIQASSSKLQFWLGGSNSGGPGAGTKTGIITCGTALSLNTWYHIALVRSGSATNNVKLYLNGVSDGQGTATYTIDAKPFGLGMSYPGNAIELFIGYIDDFRVTKGYARYTAAFTPPTQAITR